jgi:hypothetical protein
MVIGMEKDKLSKQKYIYRIYASSDKVIHCERYPVIYINSKIVYFKDARLDEFLSYKSVSFIKDEYTGISPSDLHYSSYYDEFFWKVENFDSQQATMDAFRAERNNEIANAELYMKQAEQSYLKRKEKYEELVKKYNEKEEV